MKVIFGLACSIIAFFIAVAGFSYAANPLNRPVSLGPVEALSTYFFSFAWVGGYLGTVLGVALLLGYLVFFYVLGTVLYRILLNAK